MVANLAEFLEERGHSLDIAYNGYSGLEFALDNTYDVLRCCRALGLSLRRFSN